MSAGSAGGCSRSASLLPAFARQPQHARTHQNVVLNECAVADCVLALVSDALRSSESPLLKSKSVGATPVISREAIECQVLDRPLDKNQNPALEGDEIRKVDEDPDEPRRQPRKLPTENLGYPCRATNHGERSFVE